MYYGQTLVYHACDVQCMFAAWLIQYVDYVKNKFGYFIYHNMYQIVQYFAICGENMIILVLLLSFYSKNS